MYICVYINLRLHRVHNKNVTLLFKTFLCASTTIPTERFCNLGKCLECRTGVGLLSRLLSNSQLEEVRAMLALCTSSN